MKTASLYVCSILLAVHFPASMHAQLKSQPGEWPGWRGSDRTGLSTESGLLKSWPEGGPKLTWKATGLGKGYSTPSIAGDRIFLLGTDPAKKEYLIALDAKNGTIIWKTPFGTLGRNVEGPRSTPTLDEGRAYVISSDGQLLCASQSDGKVVWKKDLKAEFGGKAGGWDYAESPLIDGDRLICTPGGAKATIVALKKVDGSVVWTTAIAKESPGHKQPYSTAGYGSVMPGEICGVRQYVQFLDGGVVGLAAEDGRLLWTYEHPASPVANCSTVLIKGDAVFAASAYKTGGGMAKISKSGDGFKAQEAWFMKDFLNHHGGTVLVDGHIYGTGAAELFCVDFETGTVKWEAKGVGKGSVGYADGHLYVRSENGPMALVEVSPAGYKEISRFSPADRAREKAWPYPVIAGGCLYLRDQDILQCYDVRAR